MKKRINLTIDADLYDSLNELPRRVSVSEVLSWTLKMVVDEFKMGREMTKPELDAWLQNRPGGRDYQERLREHWGPRIEKIEGIKKTVKKSITPKKSKE